MAGAPTRIPPGLIALVSTRQMPALKKCETAGERIFVAGDADGFQDTFSTGTICTLGFRRDKNHMRVSR